MNNLRTLIASNAANQKKASKARALDALLSLIDDDTEQRLGKEDLANLYSFFLPSPPKTPKTPFDWVAKAAAKGDIREYLNGVWSMENGDIVATNGHVIHLVKQEGLSFDESTKSDIAGNTVKTSKDFVAYTRFTNASKEYSTTLNDAHIEHTVNTDRKKTPLVVLYLGSGDRVHTFKVKKQYWDNALCGLGDNPTVYWSDDTQQSLIIKNKDGSRVAVVMPII